MTLAVLNKAIDTFLNDIGNAAELFGITKEKLLRAKVYRDAPNPSFVTEGTKYRVIVQDIDLIIRFVVEENAYKELTRSAWTSHPWEIMYVVFIHKDRLDRINDKVERIRWGNAIQREHSQLAKRRIGKDLEGIIDL